MQEPELNLYTAAQVGELDRRIIQDHGVPGFDLMGRAAAAAFAVIRRRWPHLASVAVVCGPGKNGGDGFLIAKLARQAGLVTKLCLLGDASKVAGDALLALQAFESIGGEIEDFSPSTCQNADVVIDAIFGTGLSRDIEGEFYQAATAINAAGANGVAIFAVDIPSGLDADTGKLWGVAVRAHATATFIGHKLGLYTGAGPGYCGVVTFCGLDAPTAVYSEMPVSARCLSEREVRQALPLRSRDAHKGNNGHLLCVGGNQGMGGAVRMAAEAALRSGAGLVSVATRPDHASAMTQARPELMCCGVEDPADIEALMAAANCAAIGPGLGQDSWAQALFARILDSALPLVVDADALNLLAADPVARGNWVLTPHPGEAARLLNISTLQVQADRPAAVHELARRYNAVVVLKGAGSLIAAPDMPTWLCDAGNPGMAVGGMGDVLTGVVGGLLAQRIEMGLAARVGVYLHACAGDLAAQAGGQRGLLPTDLLPYLRRAANPV